MMMIDNQWWIIILLLFLLLFINFIYANEISENNIKNFENDIVWEFNQDTNIWNLINQPMQILEQVSGSNNDILRVALEKRIKLEDYSKPKLQNEANILFSERLAKFQAIATYRNNAIFYLTNSNGRQILWRKQFEVFYPNYESFLLPLGANGNHIASTEDSLFVTCQDGSLLELRFNTPAGHTWYNISNVKVQRNNILVDGRSVFVYTQDGTLKERATRSDGLYAWYTYRVIHSAPHLEEKQGMFAAAATNGDLYIISIFGSLLKYEMDRISKTATVHNLGVFKTKKLSIAPGEMLTNQSQQTLFLTTTDGNLVQLTIGNSERDFSWIDHGSPSAESRVVSPPVASVDSYGVFVVTNNGNLAERYYCEKDMAWKWVDRSMPQMVSDTGARLDVKLSSIQGRSLGSRLLYFVTTDSKLAELVLLRDTWSWFVYSSFSENGVYCNADKLLPILNSCIRP